MSMSIEAGSHYEPLARRKSAGDNPLSMSRYPKGDWTEYPGFRRSHHNLEGAGPIEGPDKVLIKTGGNALQAVNRWALQKVDVVPVTIPWRARGGDTLLVAVPNSGRMVTVNVPPGMSSGHVLLVQIPVLAGEPVDWKDRSASAMVIKAEEVSEARLVPSKRVPPTDLFFDEIEMKCDKALERTPFV